MKYFYGCLRRVSFIITFLILCEVCVWADGTITITSYNEVSTTGTGITVGPTKHIDLAPGTYHVYGNNILSRVCFYIEGDVTIHLHNVYLKNADSPPFFMNHNGNYTLRLYLYGKNRCIGSPGYAGIGIYRYGSNVHTLHIYEGSTNASLTCEGGKNAAGIGGSRGGNEGWSAGNIYIHGGIVSATGGEYAAGIGGGGTENLKEGAGRGGHVEIDGGYVTAEGGRLAAGIGGATSPTWAGRGGTYIQRGGTVFARGGEKAAGIGGGGIDQISTNNAGLGANVTVTGGYLSAKGGNYAPAIGGGYNAKGANSGDGGDVVISGGTVEVHGDGDGIGSVAGTDGVKVSSGTLKIDGGSVYFARNNNPSHMVNSAGKKLYCVKTNALNIPNATDVQCSYNGGSIFTARLSSGYFYFWMPANNSKGTLRINDFTSLTLPPIAGNNNNLAPLIFSSGSTKYQTLDAPFTDGVTSELVLESDIPMYKDLSTKSNMVINLNGHHITPYKSEANVLTVANELTLKASSASTFSGTMKMTGNGLIKLSPSSFDNITLGNVYDGATPVYLARVAKKTEYTYGDFYGKLLYGEKADKEVVKQYKDYNVYYGWLSAAYPSLSLVTGDGTFFFSSISQTLSQKMKLYLDDMTTVFSIHQGSITVDATGDIKYFDTGGSSYRTSKSRGNILTITNSSGSGTNYNVTVQSGRTIMFKNNVIGNQLSVNAGTLLMQGNATFNSVSLGSSATFDLSQASGLSVKNKDGFPLSDKILLGTSTTPLINLNGSKVWMAKISTTNYGVLSDVNQAGKTFTKGERYFGETNPYYFWLDDLDKDLNFTAQSKYYYAETVQRHGKELAPITYKTSITSSEGSTVRYKNLAAAFSTATAGQTIRLIDNYSAPVGETATLSISKPSVTFDLTSYTIAGTLGLDANGGRLVLTSTNNGKLGAETTLSGLIYTDISSDNLTGTIKRNGNVVVRYLANKIFATDKIVYSWRDNDYSDEAMIESGNACLWLSKDIDLRNVDLGFSSNMETDKCGEILIGGKLTTHSANVTTVNPYLNIAHAPISIEKNSDKLKLTFKGVSVADFAEQQPITVYGTGTNPITVTGGVNVQNLTLRNISIPLTASQDYPAISIKDNGSKLNLYLSGKNNLKGGSKSSGVSAGISVEENASLAIYNDISSDEQKNGTGKLIVKGGAYIGNVAAGIGGNYGVSAGTIEIHGGTIRVEGGLPAFHGIGNGGGVSAGQTPVKVYSGSVDASREWKNKTPHPFQNSKGEAVYLMTVNTGLTPNKKYICTYPDCEPESFPIVTDELGKCYFWIVERTQDKKPQATFLDPATNNTTTIQLVKVDKNDKNVAPIVAELVQPGKEVEYHNNLKDAFDAVTVSGATIRLLIDIDNLSTVQTVKTGYKVTLDLDRYNLDTKNSKEAGFIAETGGYLYVTGEGESGTGNIKSTFKISGDIYIAGIVPLTDATPMLGDKAVFRTLVNGLPDSPNNIYTYSYGSVSNRTFYLHDGMACLWLPDTSGELTFRVTQGNNVTDYTAGTITTNTQRTESMGCQAVGVIARVVKGETVRDFNNLPDAFSIAAETPGNEVRLLANVALTKSVTIAGNNDFTLNLNGMGLTGATGTILTVGANRYLTITDNSTGTKGNVQMDMLLSGRLFVSGNVNVKGNVVSSSGSADAYLWRTMVDLSNLPDIPSDVSIQGGNTSKVLGQEGCYWLPKGTNQDFTFTAGGNTYPITGVNINDNHQDNLITLGIGNEEARITGKQKYDTFAKAWAAAADGDEIVLLKDATIAAKLTLDNDRNIRVDVARYTLGAKDGATIEVGANTVLRVNSGNGNGRMLVPVQNKGVLFIGSGIQSDRLTDKVTDTAGNDVWRALVSNLPDGMPDDGIYTFSFGQADPQTGSFYVSSQTACLWLKERKAERLTFPQFNSYTDNVTIEKTHANQVIWGQSNVAQVQNTMYTKLGEAFAKNTNQTVTLLKSAVLETTQEISSRMKLEMGGYSVSSLGSPATEFKVLSTGSLRVTGTGSVSTNFRLDFSQRVEGSNANLAVEPTVNMSGQVSDAANTAYWRTTVTMPSGVQGELEYVYGAQRGKVTAVDGEPLTLWLTVPREAQNIKLTRGQDSWIATSIKITGTHVNPISVQYISDEARIQGGDYYKTLAEALTAAAGGQEVVLERDLSGVSGTLALGGSVVGTVGLDLAGKRLASSGAIFEAGSARLVIRNGDLNGDLQIRGNVFSHPSLSMNGTQVKRSGDSKPVWRTLVKLPSGTSGSISYTISGGTSVTTTNIQTVDGVPYACLWLPASNEVKDYVFTTSDGKVYPVSNVLISSNHGNELDVTNNNPVVKNLTTGKEYASLNTALSTSADGNQLQLLKDITLSVTQAVSANATLDLNGHTLTSSNSGGFDPASDKTLSIKNASGNGRMIGSFFFTNSRVRIEPAVDIIGEVRLAGRPVWRVWVSGSGEALCWWEESYGLSYDRTMRIGGKTYEVTLPAGLSNHASQVKAYEVVTVSVSGTASSSELSDRNVVVCDGVTLRITGNFTLHRLTIEQDAEVVVEGNVLAEAGIVYKRTFRDKEKWNAFSLPYTASVVTFIAADDKPFALTPALRDGTGGNYWLGEMGSDGSFEHVSAPEIVANRGYLIAVPTGLTNQAISFVSSPNQWLKRPAVTPQRPQSGFSIFGNGTLEAQPVTEACYTWDYTNQNFRRQSNGADVEPFTCYVMADASYTAETMLLRISDIVGNETVEKGIAGSGIKVTTRPGCIVVEVARPTQVWVHTFDGHLVLSRRLSAGTSLIHVREGYYIVNREKVFVRP